MNKISFDISKGTEEEPNFSKLTRIDEEGLLPGTHEARTTSGTLSMGSDTAHLQFAAFTEQYALHHLDLKSNGIDLVYSLSDNNHVLTATRGSDGPIVFTAQIEENGSYSFTLHEHIDRHSPPNLVNNSDLILNETPIHPLSMSQDLPGWQIQTSADNSVALVQNIETEPLTTYQLTFYSQPPQSVDISDSGKIQIYWDNQLIYTLNSAQEAKGYSFSVEGNAEKGSTPLQFVSLGHDDVPSNINHISVTSTAQHQLPLDFIVHDNAETTTLNHFTVNVTTTPALELNNHIPFDVIVEQGVYQTIIVNDQHTGQDPLNTLLLDPLFDNLAIPAANRMVEVVQRLEDNGAATNVYEVKITDKSNVMAPITIADVQLSFPGGNGGLGIFHQNVQIHDGSDIVPLPHHFI